MVPCKSHSNVECMFSEKVARPRYMILPTGFPFVREWKIHLSFVTPRTCSCGSAATCNFPKIGQTHLNSGVCNPVNSEISLTRLKCPCNCHHMVLPLTRC